MPMAPLSNTPSRPFPVRLFRLHLCDGSHQSDEDFTYFHLPPVKGRKDASKTLFGISCNRQILTKDLMVKTDDVTRSSVQKAVVVLATQPIFGVLRQRLAVVTAAWFGQKDFTQTDILAQFYESLDATVSESIPDSAFMMGTSLRELVKKFKYKVLVLLKLLLLEKRVIFFGYPVETLCTYQYSLISLIPGLLKSLQDAGSPLLDSQELYMQSMSKTPAQSTDKQALFKYLGFPLHIFGEGSFFQPYLPLQQIDILQDSQTRSYIIGTTNAIFLHNRDCATDVIVNTEPGTVEFLQDSLSSVLSLTSADRRWMDEIIEAVNDNGVNDAQTEYTGSDDYLRAKFEEYLLTLLSSVKHSQYTQVDDSIEGIGSATDRDLTSDYGSYFIKAWQQTPNYQLWNDYVDWELLNEIVAPGHPCQGNFSLAHVQRRLANQLKDMRIDKNLQPLKQSFSRAMTTSRERLSNVFDTVWQEFEKLQPEEGLGPAASSYEPALYTPRSREGTPSDGKGIIQGTSTNPIQRPASRIFPDLEPTAEDDLDDAIVPPKSQTSSPRPPSAYQQQPSGSSRPGSSLTTGSGSSASTLSSTLGPATAATAAATAALGQRAAGMFSNVSSFFQAKKKELLEAQRDAEEQYQQRIHQHERKKRIMQERARATAETFVIPSAKQTTTIKTETKPRNSPEQGVYVYVPPKSPLSPRSPLSPMSPKSPTASKSASASTSTSGTSSLADLVGASSETSTVPIVAPIPTVPIVISPTLTRGSSRDKDGMSNQESQNEIEKELQEALESNASPVSGSRSGSGSGGQSLPVGSTAALRGSTMTPTRSSTPAEMYSPFLEISAPSSPMKTEAEAEAQVNPLGAATTERTEGVDGESEGGKDSESKVETEGS
ncbi:late secretory pathway protein avl9 [Gamsiella multidivaricata]|nr:late secretory pathway protein avl9 [Gamsiella multidivaricata]